MNVEIVVDGALYVIRIKEDSTGKLVVNVKDGKPVSHRFEESQRALANKYKGHIH